MSQTKFSFKRRGVTLAQLVKASVGQAEVRASSRAQLVELRCVSCKVQAIWTPCGTNHKAILVISIIGWLGRYTNVDYLPAETRTITVPSLSGL